MANSLVIVQWDKLEEYQQDLVIAMLNNIHGFDEGNTEGGHLWITANVLHPSCGRMPDGSEPKTEPEVQLWDAGWERVGSGQLQGSGSNGPSGQGPSRRIVFDLDVRIELGAYVGR